MQDDKTIQGFKCGLEIHQRLLTHKLFCNCPSPSPEQISSTDSSNTTLIKRKQYAVKSELGEIDRTALFEESKDLTYEYLYDPRFCCEVEMDESPPLNINKEALAIGIAIALRLNAKLVDEFQVMRKQVTDGSNTSGFQRTGLLATNGYLDTSKGKVRILTISVEEESAGIISNNESVKRYRLDRLGIPLVEIVTGPDIKDPEHAREVAERIGTILRLTGHVQRGLGTIRQDLNVSIPGGARVEIKGAQQLEKIPEILRNEVIRQRSLLEILKELRSRFGNQTDKEGKHFVFDMYLADLTELFIDSETNARIIKQGIKRGASVYGLKLPKFKGLLGRELIPKSGRRFGTELSDYAKVSGVKGIIHSDEDLDKYGITEEEDKLIKMALQIGDDDAYVLVVAPKRRADHALRLVYHRAIMNYIPEETRKVVKDTLTSFMRPLAGRSRMYPETDIPPIQVEELFDRGKEMMGVSLDELENRLNSLLNAELSKRMLKSKNLFLFLDLVDKTNVDPKLIAITLEETIKSLSREGFNTNEVDEDFYLDLFTNYERDLFTKAAIPEIIKRYIEENGKLSVRDIVNKYGLLKLKEGEVKRLLEEFNGDVGRLMREYRLVVDPRYLKSKRS